MRWEELFEWWKTLKKKKKKKKLKKEKRRHFFLVSSSSTIIIWRRRRKCGGCEDTAFFCCVSMPTLINHYVYPSLSSWDERMISIRLSVRPSAHLKNALDFPVVFVDNICVLHYGQFLMIVGITKDNVNSSSPGPQRKFVSVCFFTSISENLCCCLNNLLCITSAMHLIGKLCLFLICSLDVLHWPTAFRTFCCICIFLCWLIKNESVGLRIGLWYKSYLNKKVDCP